MLWLKAFHLIFMVTWFGGLFYLPRLYVYHASADDRISQDRFKIMEKKLFYAIMTPGALLTIFFGLGMIWNHPAAYLQMTWLQIKLALVLLLVFYHIYLGKLLHDFLRDKNRHGPVFYRWLNEMPTVFLIAIVILAVIKPAL
ncbi:MAG TPA: protoporphyrinogen oxidase HemJ [Gammaproteobacteria bacterium]|nr:protoporphyrinogen oxidase HemJ [Gammaproteobacteria bacterium]